MPISFASDTAMHVVLSRGAGTISASDLLNHLSLLGASGVQTFDQLLDLRGASLALTYEDARDVVYQQHLELAGVRGGVTVIVTDNATTLASARILEALMSFQGFRYTVFDEMSAAQQYFANVRENAGYQREPHPQGRLRVEA